MTFLGDPNLAVLSSLCLQFIYGVVMLIWIPFISNTPHFSTYRYWIMYRNKWLWRCYNELDYFQGFVPAPYCLEENEHSLHTKHTLVSNYISDAVQTKETLDFICLSNETIYKYLYRGIKHKGSIFDMYKNNQATPSNFIHVNCKIIAVAHNFVRQAEKIWSKNVKI